MTKQASLAFAGLLIAIAFVILITHVMLNILGSTWPSSRDLIYVAQMSL